MSAARDVLETLPLLAGDLGNPALRERASLAALKAGLAFSNTKTALAHSISYEMTIHHGIPHGIACSFTLPMVLDLARGRDAVLARVFPCALHDADRFLARFLEGLGVRTEFASYGVGDDESRRMIEHALNGARTDCAMQHEGWPRLFAKCECRNRSGAGCCCPFALLKLRK